MRNVYEQKAADELAEYFGSDEYRDEVQRQSASHKTQARRQRSDFGLARYFRDIGYGHAANVAAALTAQPINTATPPVGISGLNTPTRRQDSAA